MKTNLESLQVSISQCDDTTKQQNKKIADLEAQRAAVDEKLAQHVRDCGLGSWSCPAFVQCSVASTPLGSDDATSVLVSVFACVFYRHVSVCLASNRACEGLCACALCRAHGRGYGQREDVNQYAMGCETMKKSLELEKQRYRGLLEKRVEVSAEEKTALDGTRAANAILQKAIKEYDVRYASSAAVAHVAVM